MNLSKRQKNKQNTCFGQIWHKDLFNSELMRELVFKCLNKSGRREEIWAKWINGSQSVNETILAAVSTTEVTESNTVDYSYFTLQMGDVILLLRDPDCYICPSVSLFSPCVVFGPGFPCSTCYSMCIKRCQQTVPITAATAGIGQTHLDIPSWLKTFDIHPLHTLLMIIWP